MRSKNFTYLWLFLILAVFMTLPVLANDKKMKAFHETGLPLPRFVTLADAKTHVRAGPGEKYPIKWIIAKKGLPVEILLEFENWRKIRDIEGQEGWVFHTLLSGDRAGIVQGKGQIPVYRKAYETIDENSALSIYLEPNVLVSIEECDGIWCKIQSSGFSGWLERKYIWGVYESENFD